MKRTEGKITEVSRREINEAIAANNHELVAEMLERFGFVKDDTPPHFEEPQHFIAESVLTAAIIAAERGVLADDTAVTIISYLTTSVDFFLFLHDFSLCRPDTQTDTQNIYAYSDEPIGNLFASIKACAPSRMLAEKIENLSFDDFMSFLNTLIRADGLELHKAYGSPILARVYKEDMLSKPTFFAFMLRRLQAPSTSPDLIGIIIPEGGPSGFMSLLSSLLGEDKNKGEADDDNTPEKDDSSDDDNKRDCHNHCGGCCGECHGGCGGCGCRSEKSED